MRRVAKWLIGSMLVLLAGAVLLLAIGYFAIRASIPSETGDRTIAGLAAGARIVRDNHGVPHIEAGSSEDAALALGFAHGQDRLWQMHVLRMVAQGRLSEMFGPATVDSDIFLKTVDIEGAARSSFETLSPRAKAVLEAYAKGVNAHLTRRTSLLTPRLPPEFMILGATAEPWEPWQSVAIIKVMALTLDSNLDEEIRRLAMAAKGFSPTDIDEMLPHGPRDDPPPLPDLRRLFEFQNAPVNSAGYVAPREIAGLAWETGVDASNNWVLNGARAQGGKPLLANDPHLGLTAPSTFYLAHLAYGGHNIIGASLPGTPLVLLGRNDRIAWGLTTTNLDSQDLFIERQQTASPDQYLAPEGWRSFETREVVVKVKGGADVSFTRRQSRHGPILPDKYRNIVSLLPQGYVAALSWVALAKDDTTIDAALDIAEAGSVAEYLAAMRKLVSPMQSMVVADVDDNIGLIAPGRAPKRKPENRMMGRAPAPGWLEEYDWDGEIPFEELPQIVNPLGGALATANANWLPPGYREHITFDWDEHFRQARVEELAIQAGPKRGIEDMKAIQADDYSAALVAFRSEALRAVAATAGRDTEMITALGGWDGHMRADRPEPLILTAWWRHFALAVFLDDLGGEFSRFEKGYMEPVLGVLRGQYVRDWCDDQTTGPVETCGVQLAQSLSTAIRELSETQGGDWRQWRWGRAHVAWGEHRPFTSVGLLSPFFTIAVESAGGSYTLLRGRTDFREANPYASVHASAYRGVYDLNEPDRSGFIISTGQSGHFLSPHYRDLAEKWARVEYLPMITNRAEYEAVAEGIWTLHPER